MTLIEYAGWAALCFTVFNIIAFIGGCIMLAWIDPFDCIGDGE